MALPRISIIIPSLNRGDVLPRCLRSIEAQDYPNREIVVVDGGSTDSTPAVLEEFRQFIETLIEGEDSGIYDAMNRGAAAASGDVLYFMGCDDELFYPRVLSDIFRDHRNRRADFLYGNVLFRHSGEVHGSRFTLDRLRGENICHQAIFVKRRLFDRLGSFETRFKAWGDWAFNLRVFASPWVRVRFVPAIVARFDETGFSAHYEDTEGFVEYRDAILSQYYQSRRVIWYERLFGYTGMLNPKAYARALLRQSRT